MINGSERKRPMVVCRAKIDQIVEVNKLADVVEERFSEADWMAVAQIVTNPESIRNHGRLLRSLFFGDDDYSACVREVLMGLYRDDPDNIDAIREYMASTFQDFGDDPQLIETGQGMLFKGDKPLTFVGELGKGGTGRTMLFRDDTVDLLFAMKKYEASSCNDVDECYDRFVGEIKMLLRIYHPNIVRVFNYFLYPKAKTGYIQMEYIEGVPIDKFNLSGCDKSAADIFSDTISAFEALEKEGILHRDVRPSNLLMTNEGKLKLIDFGFGKQCKGESTEENNSVVLNWPYLAPEEAEEKRYNRRTEIYYVGMLFKDLIKRWGAADQFSYLEIVDKMTESAPENRFSSFHEIREAMSPAEWTNQSLDDGSVEICRKMLDLLARSVFSREATFSPIQNPGIVLERLDSLISSCVFEQMIPSPHLLVDCFANGGYEYLGNVDIERQELVSFRNIFVGMGDDMRNAVLKNVALRFSVIQVKEDDIPF